MRNPKKIITLLQVLKELKGYQRQIILDHLDDASCAAVSESILYLLKKGASKDSKLKRCMSQNKVCLRSIINNKSTKKRKRALAKVGGGPLGFMLSSVLPLLVNLISP